MHRRTVTIFPAMMGFSGDLCQVLLPVAAEIPSKGKSFLQLQLSAFIIF